MKLHITSKGALLLAKKTLFTCKSSIFICKRGTFYLQMGQFPFAKGALFPFKRGTFVIFQKSGGARAPSAPLVPTPMEMALIRENTVYEETC